MHVPTDILSLLCIGVLNDVLNLILHRLKGSSFVRTSFDQQKKGKLEEEQAKEKFCQKAYQFLAAVARLVPNVYFHGYIAPYYLYYYCASKHNISCSPIAVTTKCILAGKKGNSRLVTSD